MSSRSFEEYVAMFDLDAADLRGPVLDCCAGASGFVARVLERGGEAVAVDPAYRLGTDEVRTLVDADLGGCVQMLLDDAEHFSWDWYGSLERREELRHAAAASFLADRAAHPDRYVPAELPRLPFADGAFTLAVCSHLLFTWAPDPVRHEPGLDHPWHTAALTELLRVADTVRVFPLVLRATGAPVEFLPDLEADLAAAGHQVRRRRVPYEFQRGANEMLELIAARALTKTAR